MNLTLPHGNESILIVDDEDTILDIATTILTRFGYQTLTSPSGEEALELFRKMEKKIDLVLLDLSLPGMDGYECLEAMAQLRPTAKIIITSGYATDNSQRDAVNAGAAGFLPKPFQMNSLLETIRTILDGN